MISSLSAAGLQQRVAPNFTSDSWLARSADPRIDVHVDHGRNVRLDRNVRRQLARAVGGARGLQVEDVRGRGEQDGVEPLRIDVDGVKERRLRGVVDEDLARGVRVGRGWAPLSTGD